MPKPKSKIIDGVRHWLLDFGDGIERWSPVKPQPGRDWIIRGKESSNG